MTSMPVNVRLIDRLTTTMAYLFVTAGVINLDATALHLSRGNILPGVSFLVIAAMFGLLAAVWWRRRRIDLTLNDDVIPKTTGVW